MSRPPTPPAEPLVRCALEQGPRVFLRAPAQHDAEEFLRAMGGASRVLHRGWVQPPLDPAAFDAYLARAQSPSFRGFLVCRAADGAIAGVINISEIVRGRFQSGYLGYYAVARLAGMGLMTEGLRLVLRHAFVAVKLHRLEANIQPENVASRALVKRCGFRLEGYSPRYLKIAGRWRDHERWAILAEEWRAAPRSRRRVEAHRP